MGRNLDIAPLRSLVAVADFGGFQRAATALHLTQGAVSQHVRRLETTLGTTLVERHGRGSRFTSEGELLLSQARRILALHDETVHRFQDTADAEGLISVTLGSTEHAAAQLLPFLSAALEQSVPKRGFRFRIDRGHRLREGLTAGDIDLALLLNASKDPTAIHVGDLELTWFSSPGWRRPAEKDPIALVAFDDPCALRTRAVETLHAHGLPSVVGAEAIQLAGVQAAVAAGLGVALMATMGETPEGLVVRDDLPAPAPLPLYVCARAGLPGDIGAQVAAVLRPALANPTSETPTLKLAKGA